MATKLHPEVKKFFSNLGKRSSASMSQGDREARSRLGGYTAAANMTKEQLTARAMKGVAARQARRAARRAE